MAFDEKAYFAKTRTKVQTDKKEALAQIKEFKATVASFEKKVKAVDVAKLSDDRLFKIMGTMGGYSNMISGFNTSLKEANV